MAANPEFPPSHNRRWRSLKYLVLTRLAASFLLAGALGYAVDKEQNTQAQTKEALEQIYKVNCGSGANQECADLGESIQAIDPISNIEKNFILGTLAGAVLIFNAGFIAEAQFARRRIAHFRQEQETRTE